MIRVERLGTRITVFFVALLALVQLAAFVLVNASNSRNAHEKAEEELSVGERVFARLLQQNADKLSQAARVLTADFAFREAVATHDASTVRSALENQGSRIGASAMLYVGLNGNVIADTLQSSQRRFEYPGLLRAADAQGSSASIEILSGRGFQLVAVPVRAPLRIGWVVIGFPVDDMFARDLQQLTALEVSFFANDPGLRHGAWRSLASTLNETDETELQSEVAALAATDKTHEVQIRGVEHQARLIPLTSTTGRQVVAVLHRSRSGALAAFNRLRQTLIGLAFLSLIVSVAGSVGIASNITRPLRKLARAAARMEKGDYTSEADVKRADEIGTLASSLNHMRAAVAERERRIMSLAYQDRLTDLANRAKFSEQLAAAIERARPDNALIAIIMMDLDRFKYVNDTLGHGVGDHVLREVGNRLSRVAGSAQCIARLGGDEFALLLTGADASRALDTARAIVASLEAPVDYQGQPLDVGASVGIASYPEHGSDAQTLVRNADIAMYVAKRNKAGLAIFNPYYDTAQQEHLSLLGELRRAVEKNELRLVYQPKVSLHSTNVNAVEALLRWIHPERGIVSPVDFIPFAEHTGYIKVLTRWVLTEAIRQCGAWLAEGMTLQISANISARDLMNRELPEQIAALLAEHRVPASLLCLEITESGFMEDPAHAQKVLDQLSGMGLTLAIDDYGTGYSSLSYIMKLPVQELKIDRSFISRMVANSDISTIVRSTIELGHNLGMRVVAEGVEDGSGWDLLKSLGCDDAQGYYMSPPLGAADLMRWMRQHDGQPEQIAMQSGAESSSTTGVCAA